MYDLAIIGGMGPEATAELFRRIVKKTAATCDQEHMRICVFNDPAIPDRTEFVLHQGTSPLPDIMENIQLAKTCGCKFFAIPCNTSHYFSQQYQNVEGITFVDMVQHTCAHLAKHHADKTVCVLATTGTVVADVYRKSDHGLQVVYPGKENCDFVMQVIRRIKQGNYDPSVLAQQLRDRLQEEFDMKRTVFVLACTELSLLLPYMPSAVDALEVLTDAVIRKCGYPIKETVL